MWKTTKKLNLQSMVIDEGEQFQVNVIVKILNKNVEENVLKLGIATQT